MHRSFTRSFRVRAVALALVGMVATIAYVSLPAAPAQAYAADQAASFSGLSCTTSSTTNSSTWGSVVVPATARKAVFTITGGGGAGGDTNAGGGGAGGAGGIVTGTITVTPGTTMWARIGCGGTDADSFGDFTNRRADGYTRGGPAEDFGGGGGGASTALCVGSGTAACGGGSIVAIAGGGGGGGKGSGTGICSDQGGGAGGNAGNAGSVGVTNGVGYGGGPGNNGGGTPTGFGGSGGGNNGGGGARGGGNGGQSTAGIGNNNPPVVAPGGAYPNTAGQGGQGGDGSDGITGGGGGGGFSGGGGGGGGLDGNCTFGNWAGAGGGGAGSSWTRDTVSSISVTTTAGTADCSSAGLGTNPGKGANAGNGNRGCHGNVSLTWKINSAPIGANQTTGNATKGVGLGINLANSDDAGENLTCSIVSAPTKGNITLSGGAPSTNCTGNYVANANTSGNDTFTYKINDGLADSVTYTVTIPIVNRAPTGSGATFNVNKNQANSLGLTNQDLDFDTPLTCAVVTGPTKGTVAASTSCTKSYTPNPNTTGNDSFTYTVSDAYGGTSATYTITLAIQNRAPTGNTQNVNVDAGAATAITLTGTDLDGDTLTCTAPGTAPTKGALTGTGCARTYTSNAGAANNGVGGADSFTFTVADAFGGSSAATTVSISIANPDLSILKSHTGRFNPGTGTGTYTLTIGNSNTATANGITTVSDTLPAGMVFRSYSAGTSGFTCTGTAGVSTTITCTRNTTIPKLFSGALTITVDVAENAASPLTNSASISSPYELASTVSNNTATDGTTINHRPVPTPQTVGTDIDNPTIITLTGTDPDNDPLSFSIVAAPSNGSLSGSGSNRLYIPDTGFQGIDTFTFRVTDDNGLQSSTTATVSIYVGVSGVTGTVTNEVGGAGLPNIEVRLIDNSDPQAADPALLATAVTNASGVYNLAPQFPAQGAVPYGNYVIRFVDPLNNFIPEYYDNAPNRTLATNVAVNSDNPNLTVSAVLTPGARVQGTVRSTAPGSPTIDGLQVRLFKIGDPGSKATTTANGGQYKFELLRAGDYQLWFRDVSSGLWTSEWYDEQTSQATATTIHVTVGQQVLINEDIVPIIPPPPPTIGTITGTVRSSAPGNVPLAGIQVRLYKDPYTTSMATTTDGNGQYTFADQLEGNYKIWFRVVSGNAYVSEYYNDKPDLATADVLFVTAGTTIADALLDSPAPPAANSAVISGTVTQTDGITPIVGLQVRLYVNGVATGSVAATTDANGFYQFTGKAPGQYQLWFRDLGTTWFSEWNLDKANQATADPVTGTNGSTTTVNASLAAK